MALDSLQERERQIELLERYGSLLTQHQRDVLDMYLRRDWSLSEVAQQQEVSRAAVHDLVKRSVVALEDHERRLGLLAEREQRRAAREAITAELAALRKRLGKVESELEKL